MKRLIGWILLLSVAVAGSATSIEAFQAETRIITRGSDILVIRGAVLIDGTGRAPLNDATIVIQGNRIRSVGSAGAVEIPDGARQLDLSGLVVLPGLIDSHVHLTSVGPPQGPNDDPYSPALLSYLEHGVTTIKDMGGIHPLTVEIKRSLADGRRKGPRLFVAGPMFTAPGGHPAGSWLKGNGALARLFSRQVKDPGEAREEVRKLARDGVDFIKAVYDTSQEESPFGKLPTLDRAVLKAIIEEAHMLGLRVAVHWSIPSELSEILELSPDGLEHIGFSAIPDDLVARIAKDRFYLDPTLAVSEAVVQSPSGDPVLRENVRKLAGAGVELVAGTDAPLIGMNFGDGLDRELETLVHAGLTPMQAIQAATKNAAEYLGKSRDIGTIETGKLADLIAMAGNPLEDIRNIGNVRLVIKDGELLIDKLK